MTHDLNSELAVLEAMGERFFPIPELEGAQATLEEIVRGVAVRKDGELPWEEGNRAKCRAMMITAPTRRGKTELAEQLAHGLPDLVALDGTPIVHCPLYVECPSVFTNGLLFNLILRTMLGDTGSKRLLPTSGAFDRVNRQLPVHMPTLLVLDEFQYAFAPSGVGAGRRADVVIETLGFVRHLLDHVDWPVPVLLLGLPKLAMAMNQPEHAFLNEKITPIEIRPMVQGDVAEIARLRNAVTGYCEDAGISNGLGKEDVFFKRLIHATDNARGLAFELCKASVMAAWRDGRRAMQEADFAERYRIATNSHDDQNPFIVNGWQNTDRTRLMTETVPADIATRKKDAAHTDLAMRKKASK